MFLNNHDAVTHNIAFAIFIVSVTFRTNHAVISNACVFIDDCIINTRVAADADGRNVL